MPYMAHQLNETLRPLKLWMQVQKSSKYVDFTKVSAIRNLSATPRDICTKHCVSAHVFRLTFAHK
jgi:hypothetical protein